MLQFVILIPCDHLPSIAFEDVNPLLSPTSPTGRNLDRNCTQITLAITYYEIAMKMKLLHKLSTPSDYVCKIDYIFSFIIIFLPLFHIKF